MDTRVGQRSQARAGASAGELGVQQGERPGTKGWPSEPGLSPAFCLRHPGQSGEPQIPEEPSPSKERADTPQPNGVTGGPRAALPPRATSPAWGASTAPCVQKEEGIGAKQTGRAAKATRFTLKAVSLETTMANRRDGTARSQPIEPDRQQEGTGQHSQKVRGEPPAQGQAKEASREDPKAWDYNPSTSGVHFRGQRGHEDKQDLLSPVRQRYTGPSHTTGGH